MLRRIPPLALAAIVLFALAPVANATFPDRNGRIAFQAQTEQGVQIFTMRPNGHEVRQITHLDGDASALDWSPDGRQIAFGFDCHVVLMNADGTNLRTLPAAPGEGFPGDDVCEGDVSFTPDGEHVVFGRYDAVLDEESAWQMRLDGTERVKLPIAAAVDPNVAPDGTRISFKLGEGPLAVQNVDGTGLVQVSAPVNVAFKHDWAPDGEHLVYSDFAQPTSAQPVNIVTVRPDGSDVTYLTHFTDPRYRAFVGSYSPDGQWIIFRLEDGQQNALHRIRPDGTDLHRITDWSNFRPRGLDWGPKADR